ncbi:MAG: hypothetical protein WAX66_01225 [Patescibacteria group bacterium]
MKLPKEAVIEFQGIYKNKFGILLDFEKAEKHAINFLELMALLTRGSKNENEKLHPNTK